MGRLSVFLFATLVLVGGAQAASHLKATMKSWKAEAASAEQLLAGGKLDDPEWRRIFLAYAGESRDLSTALGAATAERRDMSARFQQFSAAADALASAGPTPAPASRGCAGPASPATTSTPTEASPTKDRLR